MQNIKWYLNRIRSMESAEIMWRLRSIVRDHIDVTRILTRTYPRPSEQSIDIAFDRPPPYSCTDTAETMAAAEKDTVFRSWMNKLLEEADSISEDKLSFLSLQNHFLGSPIDWHRDHESGRRGPVRLSVYTDYRQSDIYGDCKLVWEPNRHHQFVVLARAYRATGRVQYAEKLVSLILDWIGSNPFGYGMNWKSPLEIGIRLINWTWALDLIRSARVIDRPTWGSILQVIYLMLWDVSRKYSQGSSANNHLIGEAAGVFVASNYFNAFPEAADWQKESRDILEEQILLQSYEDGCTCEHAFGYQVFVMQFFLYSALVARKIGQPFSESYHCRLHKMYQFLDNITADTGQLPQFGDADDGYVLDMGNRPTDVPELLAVGAKFFDDDELDRGRPSETAYWIFGDEFRVDAKKTGRRRQSHAYGKSGYFILRSGADGVQSARPMSILVDCAPLGFGSISAHGHSDCLHFVLHHGNVPVFVDSGTYDYFSYPEWRSYFRSTAAHNCLVVDALDQSEMLGPFMWGKRARPLQISWSDDNKMSRLSAEHDGYTRLEDAVVHRRTFSLDKLEDQLVIDDHVLCKGTHKLERRFHLSPHTTIKEQSRNSLAIVSKSGVLRLSVEEAGQLRVEPAWISSHYHAREKSNRIVATNNIEGEALLTTAIRAFN